MRILSFLIIVILAFGLILGCGDKQEEETAADKPTETKMVKDVVCGMEVDPSKTTITAEYEGKTYYFCAEECKEKFEANPSQYAMASKEEHDHKEGEGHEHQH